jgi:UDP-3-O-[3-hydroxymyristoyl] glucosamine N-acyltransferase
MEMNKLALLVGGTVEGDDGSQIEGMGGIDSAKKGDITFAVDEDKLSVAEKGLASCILTTPDMRRSSKPLIRVKNPKLAFLIIYNALNKKEARAAYTDKSAVVAGSAKLGKNAWIGPHVSIEDNVVIGDNVIIEAGSVIKKGCIIGNSCRIYPNVTLYDRTLLKQNVILHAGVVIGADGFGYVREAGKIFKFPQLGRVLIEDDVEIGANTTIDRGSLSDTVIGAGTKIDNLCQIAHNVKTGRNVIIAGQCGLSGSSTVGDNVTMAGQVGIADNVAIGNNVMIGGQTGVIRDIKDGEIIWGYPARPIAQTKRQLAVLAILTKNFKRLSKIIKE